MVHIIPTILFLLLAGCGARTGILWDHDADVTSGPDSPLDADADTCDCDDNNPCTIEWCEEGACLREPATDGLSCTVSEYCSGRCIDGSCAVTMGEEEGMVEWSIPLPDQGHTASVYLEPGGDLIVATAGWVERFTPEAEQVWSVPTYLVGNGGQHAVIVTPDTVIVPEYDIVNGLDVETGDRIWSFQASGYIDTTALSIDGLVLISSVQTNWSSSMLTALEPLSGEVVWERSFDIRLGAMAQTESGFIYASNGGQTDTPGYVVGIDTQGIEQWRTEVYNAGRPDMGINAAGSVVLNYPLTIVSRSGEVLYEGGELIGSSSPLVSTDGLSVIVGANYYSEIRWMDAMGETIRSVGLPENTMNHAVIDACNVTYFANYHGSIVAYDRNGEVRWSLDTGSPDVVSTRPTISLHSSLLFIPTFDELYAFIIAAPIARTAWPMARGWVDGSARSQTW